MNDGDETWFFETIRNEIEAVRPVLVSFPGHMTVADGYASYPTGKKSPSTWAEAAGTMYDQYVLTITCAEAEDQPDIIAGLVGIDLSGIDFPVASTGDVNGDGLNDLRDVILSLQVLTGFNPFDIRGDYAASKADVNGDDDLGFPEAVYSMEAVSQQR